MLDEIRNPTFKLRHVEIKQKPIEKEFSKSEEVSITAHLASEVNRRRKELKKNYMDETDEESSWNASDDDF